MVTIERHGGKFACPWDARGGAATQPWHLEYSGLGDVPREACLEQVKEEAGREIEKGESFASRSPRQ